MQAKNNELQDYINNYQNEGIQVKQTCETILKQLKAIFHDEEELQRAMELIYAT